MIRRCQLLIVFVFALSIAQNENKSNQLTYGIKLGISNSIVKYAEDISEPYHKYIPHFEPFLNYSFSKWFSSGFSIFYSQPVVSFLETKSIVSTVHFINTRIYASPQLKISDLTIMLDAGPIIGINLKDDYENYPNEFKKWICFGIAGGLNFNYRIKSFEPIIGFDIYNYLTPFYESKNTNKYIKVKHFASGYSFSLGLRYYK